MSNDQYAHGHDPKRAVDVRHQVFRLPDANGKAELHLTSEDGIHYVFALSSTQVWSAIRYLIEVKSRMSGTRRDDSL